MTYQDGADRRQSRPAPHQPMEFLSELPAPVLLERLPVPVLMVGRAAELIFANRAFADMIGYDKQTLSSLTLNQICPMVPFAQDVLGVVHSHAGRVVELVHADESIVRARMSKSALIRTDDPVALVTFIDLTEEIWENPRIEHR